ncbi:hypothetical protein N6B72_12070 [Chryseobacterium soli]|uniref:hypothetical protein n=1 Tax=Chryseobacterium soli TaxID=445961 RepID=UPI002953849D|nr:hypothetical protein [Chryseobacterium soli]MDV7697658.1 hypothetical protein [Chryseobacterium soli]
MGITNLIPEDTVSIYNSISNISNIVGTTKENFFSLVGGNNDPDPHSLDKLRPGDTIDEPNDMFQQIFMFYGRNTKLSGGTTGFQEALVQFGLDSESVIDLNKSSIYSALEKEQDTFGIWDRQYTGILRNNDGSLSAFKYKNVRGEGLSKRTVDSLNKAIKDSNNYWNAQYKK